MFSPHNPQARKVGICGSHPRATDARLKKRNMDKGVREAREANPVRDALLPQHMHQSVAS
jgi:hypothetical protein